MLIYVTGAPCSGKSTAARRLCKDPDAINISTGATITTLTGGQRQQYGIMYPNDSELMNHVTVQINRARETQASTIVVDGAPRRAGQLALLPKPDLVIMFSDVYKVPAERQQFHVQRFAQWNAVHYHEVMFDILTANLQLMFNPAMEELDHVVR